MKTPSTTRDTEARVERHVISVGWHDFFHDVVNPVG